MRFVLPLAALALVAQTAQAQAPTTSLTLDEAIALEIEKASIAKAVDRHFLIARK